MNDPVAGAGILLGLVGAVVIYVCYPEFGLRLLAGLADLVGASRG